MSGPHRHYSYYWRRCRECGAVAVDCSEYCEDCNERWDAENAAQQEIDEREALEADSVPEAFPCTCPSLFESSASLFPSDRRLDRYCPQHGDGGPDPDRLYEDRRDALMENARDRQLRDNED